MATQPHKVLANEQIWPALITTVLWIDANASPHTYLRQIDVPGVDTKFVEEHRTILASLLDHQLPDGRVDRGRPPSDFAGRYRFRRKPSYVRLRRLDPAGHVHGPYSELTVRVDELAENPPRLRTVRPATAAVATRPATDLLGRHRHARLHHPQSAAAGLPHTRSMLMDRATLLAHEAQWVREPTPTTAPLPALDPQEAALYRDLVEDALGPSVRLEQERVSYRATTEATAPSGFARGIAAAITGPATAAKPPGSPWLRSVIRVRSASSGCQV